MLPGDRVAWWRDATGDERGLLMAMPFAGGRAEPVFPSLPEGWLMGHSFEAGIAAISMEIGGAYRTYLIERDEHRPGPRRPRGRGRGGVAGAGARRRALRRRRPRVHPARRARRPPACGAPGARHATRARWSASSRTRAATSTPSRGRRCPGTSDSPSRANWGRSSGPRSGTCAAGDRRDLDIDLPERGLPRAMVARRRRAPRPPRTRGPRAARADRPRDRRDARLDGSRRRHRRRRHPAGRVGLVSRERQPFDRRGSCRPAEARSSHRPTATAPAPGGPTRAVRFTNPHGDRDPDVRGRPRTDPVPSPR